MCEAGLSSVLPDLNGVVDFDRANANGQALAYVYFSNRPFGVKRFQTIHHYSVDVDLTLSIVPRGTSFHRSVEREFPPIVFDPARLSCCCRGLFPGPAEFGAVNPYTMRDRPTGVPGPRSPFSSRGADLHRPGLEPRTILSNAPAKLLTATRRGG